MKLIILTHLMILTCSSFASNQDGNLVDSLKTRLQNAKEDTNKIVVLNKLSFGLYSINLDDGIKYADSAMKLAEKLEWGKGIADANNNLGVCYWIRADYPRAMNYFYKALEINEAMADKYGQAITLNNLGLIFIRQNNYVQALKYYLKALSINEKLGNKKSIIRNLNNIADAYSNLKDFQRALEYFYRTLRLNEELNDSINIGVSLTNIGNILTKKKEYSKGLDCFFQSLRMYKDDNELNNGYNFYEIGRTYFLMTLNQPNSNNKKKLLAQC
ncbi:MAG: tetratricopeptide repeat protein [Bacteroidota bacterium]